MDFFPSEYYFIWKHKCWSSTVKLQTKIKRKKKKKFIRISSANGPFPTFANNIFPKLELNTVHMIQNKICSVSALPFFFLILVVCSLRYSYRSEKKRRNKIKQNINKQKSTILLMIETTTSNEMENVQRQSIRNWWRRKRNGRCIVIYFISCMSGESDLSEMLVGFFMNIYIQCEKKKTIASWVWFICAIQRLNNINGMEFKWNTTYIFPW